MKKQEFIEKTIAEILGFRSADCDKCDQFLGDSRVSCCTEFLKTNQVVCHVEARKLASQIADLKAAKK